MTIKGQSRGSDSKAFSARHEVDAPVIILLTSRPDPASVTIRDALLTHGGWEEGDLFMGRRLHTHRGKRGAPDFVLAETPLLHLDANGIDRILARELGEVPEAILVLSKHKAASGKAAFTVHPVGNFGRAEFGGKDGELGIAAPALQSELLRHLHTEASALKHDVTFEATHHGPLLATPTAFVEIGSGESEWDKRENGEVIARAILRLQENPLPTGDPVLVGIGGGHYVPRMTDLARKRQCAFGHLIPAYALQKGIERGLIEQAILKTPDVTGYFVDDRNITPDALHAVREVFEYLGLPEFVENDLVPQD